MEVVGDDARTVIRDALNDLVGKGWKLLLHDRARVAESDEAFAHVSRQLESLGFDAPDRDNLISLRRRYQGWYSEALRTVDQLLPERHEEFAALYRDPGRKAELQWTNYTVSDYLSGTIRKMGGEEVFSHVRAGQDRLRRQVQILESAQSRLDSLLADIRGTLEAGLFDDELAAADELHKNGFLRSAGVIAGVVLERHLKQVVANHQVTFRKRAQLGNLNDALKEAHVYDVPQWRRLQRLTDLRNLCGHDGDRDPSADEVEELVRGVEKTVATVF